MIKGAAFLTHLGAVRYVKGARLKLVLVSRHIWPISDNKDSATYRSAIAKIRHALDVSSVVFNVQDTTESARPTQESVT